MPAPDWMALRMDILDCLDSDTCLKIFMCLDDPADLVRVSCVSRSWRRFVVENCLCKKLCWKLFPPSNQFDYVVETTKSPKAKSFSNCEVDCLEKEHRAYPFLSRGCSSFPIRGLICDAISASSTDNYPDETVRNTLEQSPTVSRRASYWSSSGQSDPSVPEVLIYKLVSKICVVSEISVQPFQAYFQWGLPIYAAKAVRFRMGHLKSNSNSNSGPSECPEDYVWTYTSPIYPMSQENTLQRFSLPEPVLCLGGHLQVELLGRVQRQDMDGLFYICVCYVEAVGRSLSPAFDMDVEETSEKLVLKALSYSYPPALEPTPAVASRPPAPPAPPAPLLPNVRQLDLIMNMFRGGGDLDFHQLIEEDDFVDEFE